MNKHLKKITIAIIVLVLLLVTILSAMAWGGTTHQYICDKAGFSNLDCKITDNTDFQSEHPGTSFYYHHCALNGSNPDVPCQARLQADKFKDTLPMAAAHLYADSMVPVHWYTFDENYSWCHSQFEKEVDNFIKSGVIDWHISHVCLTKTDGYVNITADQKYLDSVVVYVAQKMNGIEINQTPKSNNFFEGINGNNFLVGLQKMLDDFMAKMKDWFKSMNNLSSILQK